MKKVKDQTKIEESLLGKMEQEKNIAPSIIQPTEQKS